MSTPRIFVLATPDDHAWASALSHRLKSDNFAIYLEPAESDPQDSQLLEQTTKAFYEASVLLVILSQESVLGESASVFEEWWRSFLESKRPIVTVLAPDAPAGAAYWMPFDLRHMPRADYSRSEDDEKLKSLLETAQRQIIAVDQAAQPSIVSRAPSTTNAAKQASHTAPPIRPIRAIEADGPPSTRRPTTIPPASASYAIEYARNRRQARHLWTNLLGWPVVVVLLLVIWGLGFYVADTYTPEDAILTVGLAAIIGLGAGVIYMWARSRLRWINGHHLDQQRATHHRSRRPPVYLEVIASAREHDMGRIFPIDHLYTTLGRGQEADIRLRDRALHTLNAAISYSHETAQYTLQNLGSVPLVLYDTPLAPGDARIIENGDLIVIGKSIVLQFRAE
jgi:hypothetical protein